MRDEELVLVKGGITTTLLNSVARIISVIFNIGKSIGTSIRMIRFKTSC
ncbi:unknown [Clostridium sp. CAG:533]|nr:unknown [Clostridium sp. CAG:533]